MGRMRETYKGHRILAALMGFLIVIACFSMSAVQVMAEDGDSSAEFVKSVANAINARTETPDMFYGGDAYEFDLKTTPMSRTFFAIRDLKAEDVDGYPNLVDYSCKVPGVVTAAYCTAYDTCFIRLPKYSGWVDVKGTLKVLILDDGTRKIDISGCDNAFAAYACCRYTNPYYFGLRGIDISGGYNTDNRGGAAGVIASLASDAYARMLGYSTTQEYIDAVVNPELQTAKDNVDKWIKTRNQEGFTQTSKLLKICIPIMALPILYGIYRLLTAKSRMIKLALNGGTSGFDRSEAIRRLDYDKYRDELVKIALYDNSDTARKMALTRLKYPDDRDAIRQAASDDSTYYICDQAVKQLSYPEDRDLLTDLVRKGKQGQFEAFEKLKYPEDRDTFIIAAKTNDNPNMRAYAADKLVMPNTVKEEADALDYVIRHDDYSTARHNAIIKLSYPENRDTIRYAAQYDKDAFVAAEAVRKLSPSEDKDIIIKAAKDDRQNVRIVGIDKIDYRDGRDILLKAAESEENAALRLTAIRKLSPDKDYEVIRRVLENDKDSGCRAEALSMLSYDKARDKLLHTALHDADANNRRIAIEKLRYPKDKEALAAVAAKDNDPVNRQIASERLPFTENRKAVIMEGLGVSNYDELNDENRKKAEKAAIMLALEPENTKRIKQFLCRNIQRGLNGGKDSVYTTLAGWSAAALGRVLALSFRPSDIEENFRRIEPAFEKFNELVENVQKLYQEFNECRDDFYAYNEKRRELYGEDAMFIDMPRDTRLMQLSGEIDGVHSELAPGPGNFMIDNGDEPMAYLINILRDNQTRVPKFVKQGVIMGLVDWLVANKTEPQAADLLKNVLEVRKDMITSDNKLAFFEVRVPEGCIRHDYEKLLADVLHCANPGVKYADMKELMDVAEAEVPGCMDMLIACPLRIIDPANQTELGFYTFEPFIHQLWYQYMPPEGEGQVTARFHEVDDRTRPLSSGLNLRLFTDPYSVIPTLFHEHEHFAGDVNEASVFLKTQMFSIDFYKKYKDAKPARDVVFATLTDLLGMPPAPDRREALNDLIKKYYGVQTSREEAEKRADGHIVMMNMNIRIKNGELTWHPEVKWPLLTDEEDKKTMKIIHDSIVKYSTAPKHVTVQEFSDIVKKEA